MSKFVVNDDMFGRYCEIATNFSRGLHYYKIVGLIESNSYCDIPLTYQLEPICHKDVVPVLLVIHCGIDETRVQRVALSDCKIRPIVNNAETKHGQWQKHYESGTTVSDGFVSSCCDMWNERKTSYCPNCGAKMDGERKDEE